MNCRECQKRVVEVALLPADDSESESFLRHAAGCSACRTELEQTRRTLKAMTPSHQLTASSRFKEKTMEEINRIAIQEMEVPAPSHRAARSDISRFSHRRTRRARWGYAVVVAAIVCGIAAYSLYSPPTVAFAQVIQKLANARHLVLKLTVQAPGLPPTEATVHVLGSDKYRSDSGDKTMIIDHGTKRAISLSHDTKKYLEMDLSGIETANTGATGVDFIERLRSMKAAAGTATESKVENGKQLQGFRAAADDEAYLIWTDASSGEVVRAEYESTKFNGAKAVMTDFHYDEPVSSDLFAMTPPSGYQPMLLNQNGPVKATMPSEELFLKFLRSYTEYSDNHEFPKSLDVLEIAAAKGAMLKKRTLSKDDLIATSMQSTMGAMFPQTLKLQNHFTYAGKGVRFGVADTPIAWYLPTGSSTYRVILADLTVEEVAPEKIPQAP